MDTQEKAVYEHLNKLELEKRAEELKLYAEQTKRSRIGQEIEKCKKFYQC